MNEPEPMRDAELFRTLPEQIADLLRQEVLSGKLKPGDPLREIEVSQRFAVSRGPIREALRQLTQQGLLVLEPNRGVRVAPGTSASVRPLVAGLRRDIECFVLEALFDSITLADLSAWEAILEDIRAACERGDTDALVEHDLRFHRALIQRHGDHDIFALWQPVVMRMMMHYTRFSDLMDSWREHRRILDAIRSGRREEALRALADNIQ